MAFASKKVGSAQGRGNIGRRRLVVVRLRNQPTSAATFTTSANAMTAGIISSNSLSVMIVICSFHTSADAEVWRSVFRLYPLVISRANW